jgi:hypothetical protein
VRGGGGGRVRGGERSRRGWKDGGSGFLWSSIWEGPVGFGLRLIFFSG